ncbi:helix-turn-helix domain-containing protein [Neobacillus drentensis]|uniref:helix-turn-helix domain-containing protein n=1 Tax=Neobacillus drentensis TaxID=220684 RepID=UPI002FFEDCD4
MRQGYGDFIKKHRLSSGFRKQKTLAEKTGISAATISRIEKEVQKPEVRTLQTLANFLETTTFVDLMVACGYWNEEDLLVDHDEIKSEVYLRTNPQDKFIQSIGRGTRGEQKETPSSNEEEFLKSIDLTDEELIDQYHLKIDGKTLSEDETKGIIAYIRSLRQMKS